MKGKAEDMETETGLIRQESRPISKRELSIV